MKESDNNYKIMFIKIPNIRMDYEITLQHCMENNMKTKIIKSNIQELHLYVYNLYKIPNRCVLDNLLLLQVGFIEMISGILLLMGHLIIYLYFSIRHAMFHDPKTKKVKMKEKKWMQKQEDKCNDKSSHKRVLREKLYFYEAYLRTLFWEYKELPRKSMRGKEGDSKVYYLSFYHGGCWQFLENTFVKALYS